MKVGLVLEGGAMRGMYTCGALDTFLDYNISFPYVIGVSAGSAFGCSYISKQRDRNLIIYEKYINDKRYVSLGNLFKDGSLFGLKFVYEDIPNIYVPFDYETFYNNPCDFYSVVTNIKTGKPEYINKTREDKHFDIFKATCALPVASPAIKIKDNYYLDGGITDPIPYKKAFSDGCDKLIVILTQDKTYRKKKQKFLRALNHRYKEYPCLTEVFKTRHINYNESLEDLKRLEKEGKVLILRPKEPVAFQRIETDLKKLRALYHIGEDETKERIDEILKFINE